MLDLRNINYNAYEEACLKFNNDVDLYSFDITKYYMNTEHGDWKKTSRNERCGFDVSWAFGLPKEKVKELARGKYLNSLKEQIEFIHDNEIALNEWTKFEIQQYLKWIIDAMSF